MWYAEERLVSFIAVDMQVIVDRSIKGSEPYARRLCLCFFVAVGISLHIIKVQT